MKIFSRGLLEAFLTEPWPQSRAPRIDKCVLHRQYKKKKKSGLIVFKQKLSHVAASRGWGVGIARRLPLLLSYWANFEQTCTRTENSQHMPGLGSQPLEVIECQTELSKWKDEGNAPLYIPPGSDQPAHPNTHTPLPRPHACLSLALQPKPTLFCPLALLIFLISRVFRLISVGVIPAVTPVGIKIHQVSPCQPPPAELNVSH